MKRQALLAVLSLTVISFVLFTKRWQVAVTDGPSETLYGFPLPFMARGFHTSLSLQFFVLELLVDLMVYFLFWCGVCCCGVGWV